MDSVDAAAVAAAELGGLLAEATRVVAFTGAGASAASGVPTYRGAGGSWSRYDPNRYASIDAFRDDPSYYWQFFRDERYPSLVKAKPNAVHFTLAELEKTGKLGAVITQNIDGLHQEAGSNRVLELHGNSRRFRCEACQRDHDFEAVHDQLSTALPPRCPACDKPELRPDVVMFGEALPHGALEQAANEMDQADLVLIVGSSLVVQPAASLPAHALLRGAALVIMNIDPTPLDSQATLVVRAPADQVLPLAVSTAQA